MPNAVLRDEIWESERFLDLAGDTSKISYFRFLSLADSFGNFEGGRRLFRLLRECTQIKTEAEVAIVLEALINADLLRRYEVESRELWHIPRFRCPQNYVVQKVPPSPWCPRDAALGKNKRLFKQGIAKNVATALLERNGDIDGTF